MYFVSEVLDRHILMVVMRNDEMCDLGKQILELIDGFIFIKTCNGDGYTNIEKYINGINPQTKTDWRNLNNNYDTLAAKGKL